MTMCCKKRAALEVEAKHAALFDKKLAQEEVWIRQGVEARRTRNEGRVRALEAAAHSSAASGASGSGKCELTAQDAAPSGKLVFEAQHVTSSSFGGGARSSPIFPRASCAATASASSDPTAAARRR